MLEKLGYNEYRILSYNEYRIFDVTLFLDKKILNINEACDNYYSVDLTKAQVQEWRSDLQKIADEMEKQIETRVMLIQDFIDESGSNIGLNCKVP